MNDKRKFFFYRGDIYFSLIQIIEVFMNVYFNYLYFFSLKNMPLIKIKIHKKMINKKIKISLTKYIFLFFLQISILIITYLNTSIFLKLLHNIIWEKTSFSLNISYALLTPIFKKILLLHLIIKQNFISNTSKLAYIVF